MKPGLLVYYWGCGFGGVMYLWLHIRIYVWWSLCTFASYEDVPLAKFMYLCFIWWCTFGVYVPLFHMRMYVWWSYAPLLHMKLCIWWSLCTVASYEDVPLVEFMYLWHHMRMYVWCLCTFVSYEDIPLAEFMYLCFIWGCTFGGVYVPCIYSHARRNWITVAGRFSSLLCSCDIFRSLVNSLHLKVFVVLNQSERSVIRTKTLKGRLPHRNQHHFCLTISMRVPAVFQYQQEGSSCFYKHQHKLGFQLCLNIIVRAAAISKERNKNAKKERKKEKKANRKQTNKRHWDSSPSTVTEHSQAKNNSLVKCNRGPILTWLAAAQLT